MKQFILLLFLISIGGNTLTAQKYGQARIDSLISKLPSAKIDSVRLKLLADISFEYKNINPDKGIEYGNQLLKEAKQLDNKKYIGYAYLNLGVNYLCKSDFPTALEYELKAMETFEQIGDRKDMAKPMNNIGIIYFNQNDMVKALEYYNKALKLYNEYGMKVQAATTLGNIGQINQNQGKPDEALVCNNKALKVFKELNDKAGIARMLANIGNIYDIKVDYPKALNNKYEAISMLEQIGDRLSLAKVYDNISYTYLHIAMNIGSIALPDSLSDKTYCLQKAEYFVNKSIQINRNAGNLNDLTINYDGLANIYYVKKDFEKSIDYYVRSVNLRDSVFSQENQRKIKALEAKKADELNKKEMEVKNLQLKSAKEEKYYYISLLLVLLIFLFMIYRYFIIQKRNNKLLSTEKKKSDDLLLNILPAEVADELKRTGEAHAKQYNHVTVLFTDFVNFTGISEEMNPGELVDEIHRNFTAFDHIIDKYGMEKIKTIGDAYLAVSGLPNEVENHALCAIKAAIEIQGYIESNESLFKVRIGVHSGPVVAGIVGVKKYAYDIWGDTVNTAARMEQNSQPGKINISGATFQLVKDYFSCTYRGKIEAKNKGVVDMYFVNEK